MKTFIWAVNPLTQKKESIRLSALAIQSLTKRLDVQIQPVFLWSNYTSPAAPFGVLNEFISEIKSQVQNELNSVLKKHGLKDVLPVMVIVHPFMSQRQEAKGLIQLAKDLQSDLIIVGTRGHKGLKRWLMGSLAETLISISDVPVFSVNPSWKSTEEFQNIFFPTDLSRESKEVFERLLDLSQLMQCSITIFHKIKLKASTTSEEIETRTLSVKQLAEKCQSFGISCQTIIDTNFKLSEPQSILRAAETLPGIIAISSTRGGLNHLVAIRTIQKVVRASTRPIWMIHPKKEKEPLLTFTDKEIMEDLQSHGRNKSDYDEAA